MLYDEIIKEDSLRPIFILGPTGSGKSSIALRLARRLENVEIVSADAYQVYKQLPILTAAPSKSDLEVVKHHLIACLDVSSNHHAAAHARMAQTCIEDIQSRGKRPIIVGGSGLYVKFISHGISEAPPCDLELRAQLELLTCEELMRRLREVDPEGAATNSPFNHRYLVRNLEIVLVGAKPLSFWQQNWMKSPAGPGFLIQRPVEELDARIALRSRQMFEEGLIEEVESLAHFEAGLSTTAKKTLGLNIIQQYIAGELGKEEAIVALALATRRYAKRQRTWQRRESWLQAMDEADWL